MLKHNSTKKNNKSAQPSVQSIKVEPINVPKDKSKGLILSIEKLASLQYKHGILKGRRANQNRPIAKRHVECKEKQRQ